MSDIADAFEEFLSSLTDEEWDALEKRVRQPAGVLVLVDREAAEITATAEAQIEVLERHLAEVDQHLDGPDPRNAIATIALKQEKYRTQTAINGLKANLEAQLAQLNQKRNT